MEHFDASAFAKVLAATCGPKLSILTPNDPPGKVIGSAIDRIKEIREIDLDCDKLTKLFAEDPRVASGWLALRAGLYQQPPLQLGRGTPYVESSEQRSERERIESHSGDALLALAVYEPLQAIRIQAPRWSDDKGFEGGELAFAFQAQGGTLIQSAQVRPVTSVDYLNARARVARELSTDPLEQLRIHGENFDPLIMVALSVGMHELVRPRTAALFDGVALITAITVQRLKHAIGAPRPDLGAATGILSKPRYYSYPGGHALVCAALTTVLVEITQADRASQRTLTDLARDIGERREKAGIHCTYDTEEGLYLGQSIGRWLVLAAQHVDAFPGWSALFGAAAMEWNPPPAVKTPTKRSRK